MKNNPRTAYPFGGEGNRQEHHDEMLATFDERFPVPFPQSNVTMITENNCVRQSTACLVNQVEPSNCKEMINLFIQHKIDSE